MLNASFEPLSVVSQRRALCLVLAEKAEVVHDSGRVFRSERLSVPAPSVVRLVHFVRVPFRRRAALSRRGVFLRDGGSCQYCGARAESIDHVVPRSRGGPHTWENVVAACRRCNSRKRDRSVEESGMVLRCRPEAPRHMSWVMAGLGEVPDHWAPYLALPDTLTA